MTRRRATLRTLGAAAVASLLLLTLATARPGDRRLYPPVGGEAVAIYLIENRFHTDVVLPRAALEGHIAGRAAALTSDKPWIAVGWGDRRFYIEEGMSVRRGLDGLRALFAPGNPSVIRLDGLPASPDHLYRSGVRRLSLSPAGLQRLVARIDASLAHDRAGWPLTAPAPPSPDSRFFVSREAFSVLHLCNHWTAGLLDAAGVPTTPVLDTLPAGLAVDLSLRAGSLDKPGSRP